MKKYDKTFFMFYELGNNSNNDSANGIDEFARKLGKTRLQALHSLRTYIKNGTYIKNKYGVKFIVLNDFILGGKKNERKRHKKSK